MPEKERYGQFNFPQAPSASEFVHSYCTRTTLRNAWTKSNEMVLVTYAAGTLGSFPLCHREKALDGGNRLVSWHVQSLLGGGCTSPFLDTIFFCPLLAKLALPMTVCADLFDD
jgi:hypothetical protein